MGWDRSTGQVEAGTPGPVSRAGNPRGPRIPDPGTPYQQQSGPVSLLQDYRGRLRVGSGASVTRSAQYEPASKWPGRSLGRCRICRGGLKAQGGAPTCEVGRVRPQEWGRRPALLSSERPLGGRSGLTPPFADGRGKRGAIPPPALRSMWGGARQVASRMFEMRRSTPEVQLILSPRGGHVK